MTTILYPKGSVYYLVRDIDDENVKFSRKDFVTFESTFSTRSDYSANTRKYDWHRAILTIKNKKSKIKAWDVDLEDLNKILSIQDKILNKIKFK